MVRVTSNVLSCFKSYDVRGEIGLNIDENIVYRIARALAQHLCAKNIVIGYDARETSPSFAEAAARGAMEAGSNVHKIGLCGTEEMYWAVTQFDFCAGIVITASHNPINFNGLKIVKAKSSPLDTKKDFNVVRKLAESQKWFPVNKVGMLKDISNEARKKYVKKIISFVDLSKLKKLKIVVNSGNGAAGPTFDCIASELDKAKSPLEFIRIDHEPDCTFPHGIPNPILPENQVRTSEKVRSHKADMGIAFDGDFDRCFFFDDKGSFISGEYIVGMLADIFLDKNPGAKIVHDTRVIWNILDIIEKKKGLPYKSKTGHSFLKKTMRDNEAIYGGELSAHHYFQDFAYCDSGMVPWLLIAEYVSQNELSLSEIIIKRSKKYPSSGEKNFVLRDVSKAYDKVLEQFKDCKKKDLIDGLSCSFKDWRFNLRKSNTEPVLRLNVEAKENKERVFEKIKLISEVLLSI
ncbi:MAG: phosphomannomutase [Pelagibacteraceae bacterium TMED65]|nr:MAG: phosphomannomutase [Pelagibacteraceae bacterium TMED65]|tara:strand:+ start:1441 stop:2826 length:1386 start_codon:yes stop_codon:yes gene_type:complete